MASFRTVALFIQCLVDSVYPEVGEALVTILRQVGLHVVCPIGQTCCGQPAFNAGHIREARSAARHFIRNFEAFDTIVCPSGSCVDMVRHHYPELFRQDPLWLERSRHVAGAIFELTEFLVDVLGVDDLGARYEGRVTYHDSCHLLRRLGIREQPRRLLRKIKGTQFIEMPASDRCCGFGGVFALRYPEISSAIAEDKVRNIVASGADTVVGCDMGCLMNIQGMISRKGLAIKVKHISEILAG